MPHGLVPHRLCPLLPGPAGTAPWRCGCRRRCRRRSAQVSPRTAADIVPGSSRVTGTRLSLWEDAVLSCPFSLRAFKAISNGSWPRSPQEATTRCGKERCSTRDTRLCASWAAGPLPPSGCARTRGEGLAAVWRGTATLLGRACPFRRPPWRALPYRHGSFCRKKKNVAVKVLKSREGFAEAAQDEVSLLRCVCNIHRLCALLRGDGR